MGTATRGTGPRQRMPLVAVQVTGRFVGGATRQDVIDGAAVLSITSGDDSDRDESAYWCQAIFDGERCTASAEAVVVMIDRASRRPAPLSPAVKEALAPLLMPG